MYIISKTIESQTLLEECRRVGEEVGEPTLPVVVGTGDGTGEQIWGQGGGLPLPPLRQGGKWGGHGAGQYTFVCVDTM